MIGPGTGVAPFRGFLQQRAADAAALEASAGNPSVAAAAAAVGESWLYFGCRRRDEDYLYGAELEAFERAGTLKRLRVAFSRQSGAAGQTAGEEKENVGSAAAAAAAAAAGAAPTGVVSNGEGVGKEGQQEKVGGGGDAPATAAAASAAAAAAAGKGKVYVQHLMREDGRALAALIVGRGAHVYVCGDGAAMVKDVHAALVALLAEHGGLAGGEREAEERLKGMAARGAYVRDVWCA